MLAKTPPGASPCRRNAPLRSLAPASALSPSFTRAPFRPAATPSSPEERPCVSLLEWWVVRVEGDDRKIAVAGFTVSGRNQTLQMFTSAPIIKRHDNCTLETEDAIVVLILGSLNISRMRENGFPVEVCEKFLIGFPLWWESWDEFYTKVNDSRLGSQTNSTKTGNSQENSTQFYLEKFQLGKFLDSLGRSFIGNLLNNAKDFKDDNVDAFQNYSCLSNEEPRFEEFNCDNNVLTTETTVASDDGCKGSALCMEVDNMASDSIMGSASNGRGHVENLEGNASLALADVCTGDETYKKAGNQNDIMHPDAREQGSGSHLLNSNLVCSMFTSRMPSDLEDQNVSAEISVDVGANCSVDVAGALENAPPTSLHRTPVASLKNQGQKRKAQHIALNKKGKKPAGARKEQRSVHEVLLGATRSPIIGRPIVDALLTHGKAKAFTLSTPESLKLRRTKSGRLIVPPLDPGCQNIVYDRDGSISGIAGLELQSPPKGSKSKTTARKKGVH